MLTNTNNTAQTYVNTATYNLNGGTLTTGSIGAVNIGTLGAGGANTSTFNFDGGTLKASSSNATFMLGLTTANVKDGGAIIDTLTKNGAGTLTLSGANTYTGTTTVNLGTLEVTGNLTATTQVAVNGGSLLIGTTYAITTNATTVTMNSGNLTFSAFSSTQTFGALTMSIDSTLNFATTGSTVSFTGFSSGPVMDNSSNHTGVYLTEGFSGTLTLTNPNSFTYPNDDSYGTTVFEGTLAIGAYSKPGSAAVAVTLGTPNTGLGSVADVPFITTENATIANAITVSPEWR